MATKRMNNEAERNKGTLRKAHHASSSASRFGFIRTRPVPYLVLLVSIVACILCLPAPWVRFDHLPEPTRPYRPLLVAIPNTLFKSLEMPNFHNPQQMVKLSQLATGLDDLADDSNGSFREGLDRLCQSVETETNLTAFGRVIIYSQIQMTIMSRLQVVQQMKSPSYGQVKMRAPVFILGMPRSGSTFLHNLLSIDDINFRPPRLWEIIDPFPPFKMDDQSWKKSIRKTFNKFGTEFFNFLTPNLRSVHPVSSDNSEECMGVLALDMLSYYWHTLMPVPSYQRWVMEQDQTRALRWHKEFFKAKTVEDKIWLLKAPWHMNHIEEIFRVYPDAKIVVTHRDPSKMLASLSSLIIRLYGMVTDDLKPNEIGSFLVEMWTTVVRRFLDARKRIAADGKHAGQIFDLPFTAFSNDPLAAVERIYPFLGLKLEGETRDRMKAWLAEDVALGKKGAAGKHEYAPEWFGLDEAELAKHPSFVEYMETLSK